VERNVGDLVNALKTAAGRTSAPYIVCICPASLASVADEERGVFFERMEEKMANELEGISGVYLVKSAEINATYPVLSYDDPHGDELGHIPYTPIFFTALGTMISRKIYAIGSTPRKVVVLDCDQTLWKGVCGEDGPGGVEVDPPHLKLQKFMVAQQEQ